CKMLKTHNWPGNIRELQHAIERAVIMSEGDEIKVTDFKLKKTASVNGSMDLENLNIQDIEKLLIEKALSKHSGNISKAAKDLGLTRAALYRRMEKYNL
ncbi:MAG: helix-turn-helix domain-containing protein, partial [Bacteroidota bacterium]